MNNSFYQIEGGHSLEGEVLLSGAKNAALPLIVAACLGEEPTTLYNVPLQMNDIRLIIEMLKVMGAEIEVDNDAGSVQLARGNLRGGDVPEEYACCIRYSLLTLGLFNALGYSAFLPPPGGCEFPRKHDLHLTGLRLLGGHVDENGAGIVLESPGKTGAFIDFYVPTTTGTENIILAASMANGTTIIRNANTRPEIQQMGELITRMGGRVEMKNRVVKVDGVPNLRGGASLRLMPGWDEALTFIIAAGVTRSELIIRDYNVQDIQEEVRQLESTGMRFFEWHNDLYVSGTEVTRGFNIFTAPYPGVDTDGQPMFAALALTIPESSVITELRHVDRFQYIDQLKCFGGDMGVYGNTAIITGSEALVAANVRATDLRGGAAYVLAALAAHGITRIDNIEQIERGYAFFSDKLAAIGAKISRKQREL